MTTSNVAYSSNTTITIGLATSPLASSATFVAGRESNEVDNTTNKYIDAIVQGKVTVGTTPTANTQIVVYVWGSNTSLATTALDVLDGTDSDETLTNTGILYTTLKPGAVISVTAATSNITYPFAPFSVSSLLGGVLPKYWGLFIAHNTGVNLNATAGNHVFEYNGITYTSA
jgi:hypothetical protein